ncbi:12866_t:CDS:2, partial [Gigaspora rosea]
MRTQPTSQESTQPSISQNQSLFGICIVFQAIAIPRKAKENKFAKTPEQLIRFFSLPKETMMCQHCLYRTDIDPEYVNLPDYQLAISKETKNIRQFQGRSYILRSNIIYPESEFQELGSAYHEVYAKLDEAKLEQVPLIRKIKLMAEILYQRQHVYNERPMLDPDEFKKMLENAKPSLRDASGASSLVIETLEGAGLTVRRKTIARQKAWHVQAHIEIVGAFITENPSCPKCRQFHNIHESHHSNTTSTHDVSHFTTILLKALPKKLSIPFNNPNQEKSIHNEKGRKNAFNDLPLQETHDEQIEHRSIENTRLVDLREGSLHSTKDYMNALKSLINIPKAEAYLKTQVLIAPMYYPGQLYIQCAIVHSLKSRDSSGIPEQILHIIPMIGPLHVSLNSRET